LPIKDQEEKSSPKKRRCRKNPPQKKRHWKDFSPPYTVGTDQFFYASIPKDMDEIDPAIYLPLPYDLVNIVLDDGHIVIGWWDGSHRTTRRIKGRTVVAWIRLHHLKIEEKNYGEEFNNSWRVPGSDERF